MENMNPVLHLLIQLRLGLERGEALRPVLKKYLSQNATELTSSLLDWLTRLEKGQTVKLDLQNWQTPYRRATLNLIARGLRGESILAALSSLETDIILACEEELEQRAALLPLKCLVPLLLFQFPALLILILGPLLGQLLNSLN
jgi:hypothetical protein